jgi:signal peptidase II
MFGSLFKKLNNYILIILSIFILDRISKYYVIALNNQVLENDSLLYSTNFLNIHLIWNSGVAFGLFSFKEDFYYNFITMIIVVVIILIGSLIRKSKKLDGYFYSMILGGAVGNLFDRIVYNAVPDFIDLHYNSFHWFIFNVADIFITFGIICLIYFDIFRNKKND